MSGGYGVHVPSTGMPKFVMVGIDRPGGSVRLYASREIPERELAWAVSEDRYGTATGWHIDAEMRNVLVIDAPTWGEAFARAFEIWGNWDRNAELEAAQAKAIEAAQLHLAEDGSRHKGRQRGCPLCTASSDAHGHRTGALGTGRVPLRGRVLDGPAHPDRTGTEVTDGTDTDH